MAACGLARYMVAYVYTQFTPIQHPPLITRQVSDRTVSSWALKTSVCSSQHISLIPLRLHRWRYWTVAEFMFQLEKH